MDRAGDKLVVDFLSFLADYVPTFPDELVDYYAAAAGFQCSDVGVKRLLSVAAQKFVAEIATDAMQFCKLRQGKQRKMTLTNDDLVSALKEYGVEMRRPDYFADSSTAGADGAVTLAAAAAAAAAATANPAVGAPPPPDQ